jgi:hypothetical protein
MFARRVIKPQLVVLVAASAVAVVGAAGFASLAFGTSSVKKVAVQPCGDRIYGHVKSLERTGDHFQLLFDPAWFTSGVTASAAAAEDGVGEPGQPVANDNYVVDESHRLLTYLVPETTPVTILTREGTGPLGATPSTVSELEQIVSGGDHRPLFESLDSGVWIRVHVDTVCSLDQQYRP